MRKPLLAALLLLTLLPCRSSAISNDGETLLEGLRRAKAPETTLQLPKAAGPEPLDRCASTPLRAFRLALPNLDPATRRAGLDLLGVTDAPSARTSPALSSGKSVVHALPFQYETANFSIEWGSNVKNEDGTTPVRDLNNNSVPDVVELWASYFEHSYASIRMMGFTGGADPLDSWKISVYLGNSDSTRTIDNIGSYYGFTDGDFPHLADTPPAYIVVSDNFSLLASISGNDEGAKDPPGGPNTFATRGAMMATAAHELHHVFQYILAPPVWASATPSDAIDWFLEGSSTWVEDRVFPFVNDYRQYYSQSNGWQRFPEYTLSPPDNRDYGSNAIRISRTYGSAIFPAYVAEHLGGVATFASAWKHLEAGDTIFAAVAAAADEAAGTTGKWSMEEIYGDFAATNALMDYEDAGVFGQVPRRDRPTAKTAPFPEKLGSSLADRPQVGSGGNSLSLQANAPAEKWALAASARVADSERDFSLILPTDQTGLTFTLPAGSDWTAVAAYLGPSSSTSSFALEAAPSPPADDIAPTPPSGLDIAAIEGGFAARWLKAEDATGVAGYVVQWKKQQDAKWAGRTILGEITTAEIRGLSPDEDHLARVFAYDSAGNLGAPTAEIPFRSGPAQGYPRPYVAPQVSFPLPGDREVAEGESLQAAFSASNAGGLPLSYEFGGLPRGASFSGGTLAWTPDFEQAGLYRISITATDGIESSSVPFIVRVTNVNRPPLIDASPISVEGGSSATIPVGLSDPDLGDRPMLSVAVPPSHGSAAVSGPATVLYTPAIGYSGPDSLVLAATDMSAATTLTEVPITVTEQPAQPAPPKGGSSSGGQGCFLETLLR